MIRALTISLAFVILTTAAHADTYSTFKTTRYYSANRRYFVEVTPNRRAVLYRVDSKHSRAQWIRVLDSLPGELLVTNDGRRVAIIDRYYGNGANPETPAVILLNEKGQEIARHRLRDVANLSKVITTTSTAHWYSAVAFTPDESYLTIDTVVAERDRAKCAHVNSPEEADACWRSVPYEQLRFSVADGKLTLTP